MTYVGIIITFVFANNIVLSQFLGVRPFIGVSTDMKASAGVGLAVMLVSAVASLATWGVYRGILLPLGLSYLQTLVFVLIVAGLVLILETFFSRFGPGLSFGIYLPVVVTNCAVFGISLISVRQGYSAPESLTAGLSAGAGYLFALLLLSAIRDSLRREWIPKPFQGLPITFISAGLMSMAFMAFDRGLLRNLIE